MKIAVIGECMVELTTQSDNPYQITVTPDTLNATTPPRLCDLCAKQSNKFCEGIHHQQMPVTWGREKGGTAQKNKTISSLEQSATIDRLIPLLKEAS